MYKLGLTENEIKIFELYAKCGTIKGVSLILDRPVRRITQTIKKVLLKTNTDNKISALCKLVKEKII